MADVGFRDVELFAGDDVGVPERLDDADDDTQGGTRATYPRSHS
jgi:hypothetical protein